MTAFCGITDASGNPIKPNIMMNGTLHEDFDNFVNDRDTYYMYYYRLLEIAMSVFEWKNLPEGVDERQLEWWLLVNGYCLFFYDEDLKTGRDKLNAPEGYAVLQCTLSGEWNMYMLPTWRHAYSVDGINVDLDESNSVIIFNNYLRTSMILTLRQYAWRLANADRTIDVNVSNQKTTKIIPTDDRNRLTLKNLNMSIYGNKVYTIVDKNLDLNTLQPIDLTVPYVAGDLQTYKHQLWNEALTYLGVENVNTEKKERLISDEVFSNMGDVEAQRFARLNARKKAAREINELFGLDIDVDFRSGIYIHADGYGAQEIPTSGMQDSSVITEDGGYGSNDSGVLASIKRLLGMGA